MIYIISFFLFIALLIVLLKARKVIKTALTIKDAELDALEKNLKTTELNKDTHESKHQ
jgi:hypothetical protein